MPKEVEDCVQSVLEDNPDYSESKAYAICEAQQKGYDDPEAVVAVAEKQRTGDWPSIHPSVKTAAGREHLLDTYADKARELTKGLRSEVSFEAQLSGPRAIFKVSDDDGDDRFVVWGKASVEVVDKEGDKITADALRDALPQLLRRERLSLQHSDQLVGKVLESFETDSPVTAEIDGKQYTREDFPTDVLKLDGEEPTLFVAGEIWADTRQARKTREDIETGDIDSYSISGEAISTKTKVKDGDVYDEITELDLSAVTLCEEGMNHKAKFGTVVKIGDDSISPENPGRTSDPRVAVVKSDNNEIMSDDDTAKSGGGEAFTPDELRQEFRKAADDALADADFVTTSEMKSYVDDALEEKSYNASDEAGDEDDEEDDDADEKAEDNPEEYQDNEDPDGSEREVDPEDDEDSADDDDDDGMADKADDDVVDPDEIEDPDDDGEEEVDLDPAEDDDMPPEGEDVEPAPEPEETEPEPDEEVDDDAGDDGDVVDTLERQGVPDDLVDAVKEYVDNEAEPDALEMSEDDDVEESTEKSEEPIGGADLGGDLDKAETDQEYLDVTASGAIPSMNDDDEDLMKSFEREDGPDVEDTTDTLEHLYKSLGEEPV